MEQGKISTKVRGEDIEIYAERAIFWPRKATLIVADLHWGKGETFRQHGIPIPHSVFEEDLERLTVLLELTKAHRLIVLGDLIHSLRGLTPELISTLKDWREQIRCEIVAVKGNHDRGISKVTSDWKLTLIDESFEDRPFLFRHEPEARKNSYVWAGHLHPTIRLESGRETLRFPCFHLGPEVGVLPSFCSFTRGVMMKKGPRDHVFLVVNHSILEM